MLILKKIRVTQDQSNSRLDQIINKKKRGPVYSKIWKLALKKIKAIKYQNKGKVRLSQVIKKDRLENRVFNNLYISFKED